eukprot:8463706-Pyramimonas_sp.AAC.1
MMQMLYMRDKRSPGVRSAVREQHVGPKRVNYHGMAAGHAVTRLACVRELPHPRVHPVRAVPGQREL